MKTKTKTAQQGSKIAEIIGKRSQNICIKIAHINPALSNMKSKIKLQRVNP